MPGLYRKFGRVVQTVLVILFFGSLLSSCGSASSPPIDIPTPVSHIGISSPDSDSYARVTGLADAADAETTVTITNTTQGITASLIERTATDSSKFRSPFKATANADGSFQVSIQADVGDTIEISRTSNGTATTDQLTVPENIPPLPLTATNVEDVIYNPTTNGAIVIGNNGVDGFLYFMSLDDNSVTSVNLAGLSGANRISLDTTGQIVAILDADDLNNVSHYDIAADITITDSTAGVAVSDISVSSGGGSAILANATSTPSLSYYDLTANSVTAMDDIVDGASNTQTSAALIDVDNDGIGDIAAVVSLMPDGTYFLSTNLIDPVTPASIQSTGDTLTGMSTPGDIDYFNGADDVVITDRENDRVFRVTISTATIGTISVGDDPRGVAVLNANNNAYVVNSGDRTLSIIDLESEAVDSTTELGLSPTAVAADPTGASTSVIILNTGDNTLTLIN